jgi:hypothetical protein
VKKVIRTLATPKGYIACFTVAVLIAAFLTYTYIASFKNVVFTFDTTKGSITLTDSAKKVYTPAANEEIRLKKGEYTLSKSGDNIAKSNSMLTINDNSSSIAIDFSYTDKYLETLYEAQQIDIYSAILQEYPAIKSDYTITGGRLYNQGEWFGAALTYNNRQSTNRDTLRILLHKQDDKWDVISKPPTPILSKADYPDAPYDTLKAVNRVK